MAVLSGCNGYSHLSRTKVRGLKTIDGVGQPDLVVDTLQSVLVHVDGPLVCVEEIL